MRFRWLLVACFLLINTVAAVAAEKWTGAAICGGLTVCLLIVGLIEAAQLRGQLSRQGRRDPEAVEEAIAALSELVALKDGPRDSAYQSAKPLAWSKARGVLARLASEQLRGTDGGQKS